MRGDRTRAFRASPNYELIPFDRLTPGERAFLGQWGREASGFGILRPRPGTRGTIKAVSRDTALLLYALQIPGPVPVTAVAAGDESIVDAVWKFVLDGVLEVERDGVFVSGAAAAELKSVAARPHDPVAAVSFDAVHHVARNDGDAMTFARRLYQYNRRPLTPKWAARIPTSHAVLRYANSAPAQSASGALAEYWEAKSALEPGPWLSWWQKSHTQRPRADAADPITYKVYVAPALESIPDAFPIVVDVLATAGAPPFKLASTIRGLMRPDKIVCYFMSRSAALDVASQLESRLGGCTAQPVPFTESVGMTGMVSMGADPPADRPLAQHVGVSWRQWVCRRLGTYLREGRKTGSSAYAAQFALERLRIEGIDPQTWVPAERALDDFVTGCTA